jgi:hypothetical protein
LGDAIANVKSTATKDEIEKCGDCKVLDYVNSPASEAAQRQPQLPPSWIQRFGHIPQSRPVLEIVEAGIRSGGKAAISLRTLA